MTTLGRIRTKVANASPTNAGPPITVARQLQVEEKNHNHSDSDGGGGGDVLDRDNRISSNDYDSPADNDNKKYRRSRLMAPVVDPRNSNELKNVHDKSVENDYVVDDKNNEECDLCGDGGELICCDFCPKSFHANCLHVEPDSLPDPWYCSSCMVTNTQADNNDKTNAIGVIDKKISATISTTAAADHVKNNATTKITDPPTRKSPPIPASDDERKLALIDVEPKVNMSLDILDSDSYYWSKGLIICVKRITPKGPNVKRPGPPKEHCIVTVRYEGWGSLSCEDLSYPNERLAPVATYTKPVKCLVTLSGLKTKDMGLIESNKSVQNWTNVWPCKIYLRTPHKNNVHASNLLRNQSNYFVQPYMTYLLPHYLAKHMSHGGQWLAANSCHKWRELSVKDSSTEVTCILHEVSSGGQKRGTDLYLVTDKFCQAFEAAQMDPLSVDLPTSLFPMKKGGDHDDSQHTSMKHRADSHSPKMKVKSNTRPLIGPMPEPAPRPVKKRESRRSKKRNMLNPILPLVKPKPRPEPAPPLALEFEKRQERQTSVTRRRSISPRPTTSRPTSLEATAQAPAHVKSASLSSSLPSWYEHYPFLPPPTPITDMAYPIRGVRYLPNSHRWASVLRVSGNDLFVGAYESQSEAAHGAKLALEQSKIEKMQAVGGVESINDLSEGAASGDGSDAANRTPRMAHFTNVSSASTAPDAGKLADLFNTSAESIVSAFENAQLRRGQKQSSDRSTRFHLQDWMNKHSAHKMQERKGLGLSSNDVLGDEYAFLVTVGGDESVHRKRRKQSNPRRLSQMTLTDADRNITHDN